MRTREEEPARLFRRINFKFLGDMDIYDAKLTDHYPLQRGGIVVMNMMCQGRGKNNDFGIIESEINYQRRLRLLSQVVNALIDEGVTLFLFQEAPRKLSDWDAFLDGLSKENRRVFSCISDDVTGISSNLCCFYDTKHFILNPIGLDAMTRKPILSKRELGTRAQSIELTLLKDGKKDGNIIVKNIHGDFMKQPDTVRYIYNSLQTEGVLVGGDFNIADSETFKNKTELESCLTSLSSEKGRVFGNIPERHDKFSLEKSTTIDGLLTRSEDIFTRTERQSIVSSKVSAPPIAVESVSMPSSSSKAEEEAYEKKMEAFRIFLNTPSSSSKGKEREVLPTILDKLGSLSISSDLLSRETQDAVQLIDVFKQEISKEKNSFLSFISGTKNKKIQVVIDALDSLKNNISPLSTINQELQNILKTEISKNKTVKEILEKTEKGKKVLDKINTLFLSKEEDIAYKGKGKERRP